MKPWELEIQRDITPFADPGATVEVVSSADRMTAKWRSRRKEYTATFVRHADGEVRADFLGRDLSYRGFLSSQEMGDLLGIAQMILQSAAPSFYVETKAHDPNTKAAQPAVALLRSMLVASSESTTRVLFITGDAGAGKTEVLRHLVRQQADHFVQGAADHLYLYVNAQGRALARLDEALASELDDLRAHLTYHAVPCLARVGALIPVIDGFDELLGVTGYDDAFSSLQRFLDDLDGRGQLVASARSTYYEQEFLARAARSRLSDKPLELVPINVLPWGNAEFQQYVRLRFSHGHPDGLTQDEFRSRMAQVFDFPVNRPLRSKPFFVAKTADLILDGAEFSEADLLEQLVSLYVERERTEKLLDRNHRPLLAKDQIEALIQFICDEMWALETRVIDVSTVRDIADIVTSDESSKALVREVLLDRAPKMAFFRPAQGRARIEFEHELFFAYFLSKTIASALISGPQELTAVLMRSALPPGASDLAVGRLTKDGSTAQSIAETSVEAAETSMGRAPQVRENAANLVVSALTAHRAEGGGVPIRGLTLRFMIFAGSNFQRAILEDCDFIESEFRQVDLSEAQFIKCRAKDILLNEPLLDPKVTRLELSGLDPAVHVPSIKVRSGDSIETVYVPARVLEILSACGVPNIRNKSYLDSMDGHVVKLIESLMQRFELANVIWPLDSRHQRLVSDPAWSKIEDLMVRNEVATKEVNLHQKGKPRPALRRNFLPSQIMVGMDTEAITPPQIKSFWAAIRREFPAKSS